MSEDNYRYPCALLVDDDSTDNYINKRILELSQFAKKIVVKKSCAEALDYIRQESNSSENFPNVVFLDYFMPVQGGKEFLDHFEKLPEEISCRSKVVMLSVLDEELNPEPYDRKNVFNSISKPLTEEKLEKVFYPSMVLEKSFV